MQTNTVAAVNSNNVERLTTTERSAAIRADLKKILGATAREVSVRCDKYSMGSSIYVTVKTGAIALAAVEAIANQYESVARCEMTGEILNGGNIYMHVEYSDAALAPVIAAVVAAMATGDSFRGLSWYLDGHQWRISGPTGSLNSGFKVYYDQHAAARGVALMLLDGHGEGWGRAVDTSDITDSVFAAPVVNSQVAFLEAVGAL
jgi:hypothetical protein